MSESDAHKRAKARAAGKKGKTEKPISRNRRLDAQSESGHRATEVERSGSAALLRKAAKRLADSGARQKVLQVPQHDMDIAAQAMRNAGVGGTVKNMSGTNKRSVPKPNN